MQDKYLHFRYRAGFQTARTTGPGYGISNILQFKADMEFTKGEGDKS
jgi:hypothetical protein